MAEVAVFQDQQSSGVQGLVLTTSISDQPLNTEVFNDIAGCSLSANKVTLPAGNYIITVTDGGTPGSTYMLNMFITDASNTVLESKRHNSPSYNGGYAQHMTVTFTIKLSVETEIKYRASTGFSNWVRNPLSAGTECYQKLIIQKIG